MPFGKSSIFKCADRLLVKNCAWDRLRAALSLLWDMLHLRGVLFRFCMLDYRRRKPLVVVACFSKQSHEEAYYMSQIGL